MKDKPTWNLRSLLTNIVLKSSKGYGTLIKATVFFEDSSKKNVVISPFFFKGVTVFLTVAAEILILCFDIVF